MSENKGIKDPSGESWYVEKYAQEDNEVGWFQVGNLSEDEQKSLVYYLLSNLGDMIAENTLDEIISHKPALLDFYREALFSDLEMLEEIRDTNMENWWNLARGARDEEVDVLLQHYDEADELVAMLLLGADTDYALQQLAARAKGSASIIEAMRDMHLILREDGTFERRYVATSYDLFKVESDEGPLPEGINLLTESEKALKGKVPTCKNDLLALLSCDFTKLAPFKGTAVEKIGSYHFFSSNCEACDAWLESYAFKIAPQAPWDYIGTYTTYGEDKGVHNDIDPDNVDCDPDDAQSIDDDIPEHLLYTPHGVSKNGYERIATLGGRPRWVQSPEIPDCPECGKMMFYIGRNQASEWTGSIGDQVVFGFACEDCLTAVQVMQCT